MTGLAPRALCDEVVVTGLAADNRVEPWWSRSVSKGTGKVFPMAPVSGTQVVTNTRRSADRRRRLRLKSEAGERNVQYHGVP